MRPERLVGVRTRTHGRLGVHRNVARAGVVTPDKLQDAAAVAALFANITRYANAFDIPSPADFDKAAGILLRRGYA